MVLSLNKLNNEVSETDGITFYDANYFVTIDDEDDTELAEDKEEQEPENVNGNYVASTITQGFSSVTIRIQEY